jgi:tetratricopeptide (TPR) repeat protein
MRNTSFFLQEEARTRFARHYLTECQKCPDAWSKCEPCDSASVVEAALALARHLHYLANGKSYEQSEFQEAIDFVTALRLPSDPHRSEVWVGLADLYHFDLNRPTLATEYYQRVLRESVDSRLAAHATLALGEIHFAEGDSLGAEKEFRKAAKLGTGAQALCATYKQAWALARLGRARLAQKAFRVCAQADPRDRFAAFISRTCAADERRLYP